MSDAAIRIFTIGFAGKSAAEFFGLLGQAQVRRVIDVRLYNRSQLAGYTKQRDLEFFLRSILGAAYTHMPDFAPTKGLLDGYKNGSISWPQYEAEYQALLARRQPHRRLTPTELDRCCLLCAEKTAGRCHRRLAAEYLQRVWPGISIAHV